LIADHLQSLQSFAIIRNHWESIRNQSNLGNQKFSFFPLGLSNLLLQVVVPYVQWLLVGALFLGPKISW
jgi:hypothetical protein